MDNIRRGTMEMSVAMAILGTIGWFIVRSGVPVIGVVFWRCAFGAATLGLVCAALGLLRGHITLPRLGLAVLGGVAIVLNWLLLFGAFSRASISMATAVYNTQPFMLVAFGALFLGERMTPAKLGWLLVSFLGMLLVVQAAPGSDAATARYLSGIAMALGAAFFWAIAAIVAKRLTGTPPHLIAFVHVCVGVVMLAPYQSDATLPHTAWSWGLIAVTGVVHTGLVYILMYSAIQRLPTHLQAALSFIYPVIAILVDVVAFQQHLRYSQVLGAAAILLAAAGLHLKWSLNPARWIGKKDCLS